MISLTAVAALVLAVAGCASVGDREAAVADAAVGFLTAVQHKDGAAACAALLPSTVSALEDSAGSPCPQAIVQEDLPDPGSVRSSAVYGQWAQVHLTDDTVFLGVYRGGWRVAAAGCRSQGEQPYQCTLAKG